MDFYLDDKNCLERLYSEYKKYGTIIIAYDFDDTIYNFHNIKNRNYNDIIILLQECKSIGRFICFTASNADRYPKIEKYIRENNIPLDKINEGFAGVPNGIKPYYNVLLDDRAGLSASYNLLKNLLKLIENEEKR